LILGILPPAAFLFSDKFCEEASPVADESVGIVAAGEAEYSVVFTSLIPRTASLGGPCKVRVSNVHNRGK